MPTSRAPTLTALDRAIAWASPAAGVARAAQRAQLAAYQGLEGAQANVSGIGGGGYVSASGQDTFLRRWFAPARDAKADTLPGLPVMRGQSRDLVRNHPIAASAINTNVVRAVGTGLACSPTPHVQTLGWTHEQAEAWRAEAQAEFSLWADSTDCDYYGRQTFYDMQDLVLRSALESGDSFSVLPDAPAPTPTMPYRLRVQILEADRVGNPFGKADDDTVAGGIQTAPGGAVQRAHVYDKHPGSRVLRGGLYAGQWYDMVGPSGRRRMLHHYKVLRPEMPRGVPYLAPVMGLFKLLGTYTDAEVKAAVVSAFLTVFIKTPSGAKLPPVLGHADVAGGQQPNQGAPAPGGPAGGDIALAPAAIVGLAEGESIETVNPGRPNPAFGPFVDVVLDQLGAGTFIGREMLMKKYATSYTAARAAWLDAWKHLLDMRTTIVARTFCQPVYETWMAEAVALGRIRAPGFFNDARLRWAYTRCAWHGDSQGSLNPKDEVTAYGDAVDRRLMTREQAEWQLNGTSWQDTYPTKLAEHQRMVRDQMLPVPKAGAPAPQPTGDQA